MFSLYVSLAGFTMKYIYKKKEEKKGKDLGHSQRGTKAIQSLFKEMTRPVFWQHPMQPMRVYYPMYII